MKRLIMVIALCVMTFWGSTTLMAGDFGVIAGASFTGIKEISVSKTTGYHAGITYKFRLPVGFAIQPSLMYHMKSSTVNAAVESKTKLDMNVGYLELPVSFQWGPDLLVFRPFVDVAPFIGYAVNNDFKSMETIQNTITTWKDEWGGMSRLEYGLGVGLGLEIWKIQILGRYNWNFGSLFKTDGNIVGKDEIFDNTKDSVLKGKNFGGVTLSVALLF